MMMQRTTLSAASEDLETLKAEARRQGKSFARFMGDLVAEKAAEYRVSRRPRVGVVEGDTQSAAEESTQDEDSAASTPFR